MLRQKYMNVSQVSANRFLELVIIWDLRIWDLEFAALPRFISLTWP